MSLHVLDKITFVNLSFSPIVIMKYCITYERKLVFCLNLTDVFPPDVLDKNDNNGNKNEHHTNVTYTHTIHAYILYMYDREL